MLIGSAAANNINGQGGDDVLVGLADNDMLDGGAGADLLLAGDGDDALTGGIEIDVLAGGRGADTFNFAATDANADGVPTTNADWLVDYSFVEGDTMDLSALLDTNFGTASNLSDFVRLQTSGSNVWSCRSILTAPWAGPPGPTSRLSRTMQRATRISSGCISN